MMARHTQSSRLFLVIAVLTLLFAAQPIKAESPPNPEAGKIQNSNRDDQPNQANNPPISIDFNANELDAIAASLPEGEARQMLEQKRLSATESKNSVPEDTPKHGEEFGFFIFNL